MTTYDFDRNVALDFKNGKIKMIGDVPSLELESAKYNLNQHYSNGLSKYIQKISINVVEDITECRRIWQMFSRDETLFDNWQFRMQFFDGYNTKPYFLTIKKGSNVLACLPLMFQNNIGKYTWFGSDWMENNRLFTVSKFYVPILLYFAPKPLHLPGLNMRDIEGIPDFLTFEEDDSDYYLDLNDFINMESYLKSLTKKRRYNLKRDHRKIENLKPEFIANGNFREDFFKLIEKRMHQLGELAYFEEDHGNRIAFENLLDYSGKEFSVELWTSLINGSAAVCDLIIFYKDMVYPLLGGNDVEKYSGIGNYINFKEIEYAIDKGYKKIDYLQINYGWKDKYLKPEKRFSINLNK